jgi:hypothetical protein
MVYKEQLEDKTCCRVYQGEPGEIINETMEVEKDNMVDRDLMVSIQKPGSAININPQFKEDHLV